MESLPTEQNDIEKLNAEPATGPGAPTAPVSQIETAAPTSSPVAQDTPSAVPQTPQPQFDPPIVTPPNVPKKSHKKRNIIIAVVVLLLLAAGTVAAVMLFSTPKKDTAKKSTTETTKPLDDAQGIVTKINTAITDTSKDTYQNPQVSFISPTSVQPAVSPSYQVKGADYYVVTNQAYGLNIQKTVDTNSETGVDTVFTQGVIDQVTAALVDNKYNKTTELSSGSEYQSDAVICTVSGAESIPIYVTCANKNTYAKVSSDVKPLVTAYRASHSDSSSEDIFSAPTIKNSSVDGYQTASVGVASRQGIGSAAALFYRKGTDEWKFFNFTQAELSCSEYNTTDLKAAFADQSCISDNKTDTTVKEYTPSTKKTSGSTNSSSNSTSDSTTKNDTTQNSGAASSSTNP